MRETISLTRSGIVGSLRDGWGLVMTLEYKSATLFNKWIVGNMLVCIYSWFEWAWTECSFLVQYVGIPDNFFIYQGYMVRVDIVRMKRY